MYEARRSQLSSGLVAVILTSILLVLGCSPAADPGPANQNPDAKASVEVPQAGGEVLLDASESSDPDGDALSFQWTRTSGPNVPINNANQAVASVQTIGPGTYQFSVEVTDGRGGSDTATVTFTVN
jgi:hypothetical protein